MNTESLTKNAQYCSNPVDIVLMRISEWLDPLKKGEYVGEKVQEVVYQRRVTSYQIIDELNILTIDENVYKDIEDLVIKSGYLFEHQFEEFDDSHGWFATNIVFSLPEIVGHGKRPSLWVRCYGYTKGHVITMTSRSVNCYRAHPL